MLLLFAIIIKLGSRPALWLIGLFVRAGRTEDDASLFFFLDGLLITLARFLCLAQATAEVDTIAVAAATGAVSATSVSVCTARDDEDVRGAGVYSHYI